MTLLALAAILSTAGCSADEPVTVESLLSAMATGSAPRIVDVRTTREYRAGHVPGAIHIPYHEVWLRRADLAAARTDPIVVYCSHGPRAGMAAFQLWVLGYRNVAYLPGQMSGWKRRGLPVETGPEP